MLGCHKLVLIGEQGVGKSTILSLMQGRKDLKKRNVTVGVAIEEVFVEDEKVACWDLGGQDRFQFMWSDFIRGAGLTVLVTDSTEENLEQTKQILERYNRFEGSKVIAIANKQDRKGALKPQKIANELGLKTYSMCAINPVNRSTIKQILRQEI